MHRTAAPAAEAAGPETGSLGRYAKRFLGGATLLSVASILQRGIGFFLLPVYTRYLSPEDYGLIEVLMVTVTLTLMILGQGVPPAVVRQLTFVHARDEARKKVVAGTALLYLAGIGVVAFAVVATFSSRLAASLLDSPEYGWLIVIGGVLLALGGASSAGASVLMASGRVSVCVTLGLIHFAIKLALNLLLVVVWQAGFAGIIWSHLIGDALGLLATLWYLRPHVTWRVDRAELRGLLRYGVPLTGGHIGQQLLSVSDRYVIQFLRSGTELGLYAVAAKFSGAFYTMLIAPMTLMWESTSLEFAREREGRRHIASIANFYLLLATFVCLVAMWLLEPLLRLVLSEDFLGAEAAIGILIGGTVFHGLAEIFKLGLRARGRTGSISGMALAAAAFNLALTFAMVPRWGFVGAAIATVFSFAFQASLNGWAAQKEFPVPWDLGRLLIMSSVLLGACTLQPWLETLDAAARFDARGWLVAVYVTLVPLLMDERARGSAAEVVARWSRRLRPALVAEEDGRA